MADKKISALPSASTPLTGSEVLPIVQGGVTDKVSVNNLTAGRTVPATRLSMPTGSHTMYVGFDGATDAMQIATQTEINLQTGSGYGMAVNIDSSHNVNVSQGNVKLSTAGKGIDFSANGGDVLTQYDEGTWTPNDASGAGLSLTVSSATYTRIGRMVTAQFDITFPTTADTNTQLLGGLPFAPAAINFGGFISYTTHANALNLLVYTSGGNGVVSFRRAVGGSNNNNAAYSGNVIRGVLVYFV